MAQFLFKSTPKTTLHGPLGGDIKTELKILKFKPPVTVFNGFFEPKKAISAMSLLHKQGTQDTAAMCAISHPTWVIGGWGCCMSHQLIQISKFKPPATVFLNSNQPHPHCRRTSQGTQDTTALCAISPPRGAFGGWGAASHISTFKFLKFKPPATVFWL